jgi:hypothetical protein
MQHGRSHLTLMEKRGRSMKRLILVLGLLGVLVSAAFGQGTFLQVKIPFEFVVGGNTFPAGTYTFSQSNQYVQMKSLDTGESVPLGFLTRLAADRTPGTAGISFDVQEGKHFIETVWPKAGDGYLVHMVKGNHTHEIVKSE